jgi:hypothetical protein
MDKSLNGINAWAHRMVVGNLMSGLGRFSAEAPVWFKAGILVPLWRLQGLPPETVAAKREELRQSTRLGMIRVGITVCFAVLMLALLFLF